ncbi:uncharacterized protein DSM5745_02307 [Aspergillus mulundensis]|uniref:DUF7582 domain-containing protein n=1 Tax=Aspergillus mulundensis TaxID=1810919 RepID=A0A3D8SW38_9EURO|nr:Uncharacterized protein DSM5745_02307 [Aspergillus mulundensis]RDW90532.1 Uncharacterized protein DSM5745_02307 [Aspergillus mulundensis]
MVAIRLPRPTGVYVPNSPRSVTSDMISSPLSADFNFDSETLTPSIIPALEYISYKLQQKHMHVTLLVGRGKPYPTGQPSDLIVIPSTTLEPSVSRTLTRTIAKAAARFSLGQSWSDALARSHHERHANEYLIERSILQNEVVFSREGLTLLNVDRIYTFKRRLCILSTSTSTSPSKSKPAASPESYINSCVRLLHRTIEDFNGRPFSKAFFHRVYEQLDVSDELLSQVADIYRKQYSQDGIVIPPPPKPAVVVVEKKKVPVRPVRPVRVRKASTAAQKGLSPAGTLGKRGPKTPLSASDVTPITRNEWNLLFGPGFKKSQPTVTKWTPSPTVLAAACG